MIIIGKNVLFISNLLADDTKSDYFNRRSKVEEQESVVELASKMATVTFKNNSSGLEYMNRESPVTRLD